MVINGPNLSRLGAREPEVYGPASLADLETVPGVNATTAKAVYDYFHANG